MDKNIFISTSKIVPAGSFSKLVISIFDKDNKTSNFSTSLMTKYNTEKYEKQALELLGFKNWFDITYGTLFPQLTVLTDSDNEGEIVGLACKNGLLLKNEVKFFQKQN
ncbi:MAG: hypothetical protein EOM55_00200 [Clostridia bacterium]|nr:hypothetical protein [Clostridia bacterium]